MTTIVSPLEAFRSLLLSVATEAPLDAGVPVFSVHRDQGIEPPFMVVAEAGSIRHRTGPAYAPARASLTAYAFTDREAADLYLAASERLHRFGPAVRDGVGIFKVFDETGLQQPFQDPDTSWWRAFGVWDLVLLDRVVV